MREVQGISKAWAVEVNLNLINDDCMSVMRDYPDNYFDLAIVDPPYGMENKKGQATSRIKKYGQLKTVNDAKPCDQYIVELMRCSKNQIIWGYNHLSDILPSCREFIFWFKHQPVPTYSDGELAWTSFQKTAKCFNYPFFGSHGADVKRIHPTQKPIKLYEWLYDNYAEKGQKILDTHLGSGSNAIAAHYAEMGEFVGIELDADYFNSAKARIKQETKQVDMFAGVI